MSLKVLRLLSRAAALLPFALDGQIVLDGTMGHAGALTGPNYQITAALGKQSGGNLFQSFSSFNLAKGELASFSGPNSVQNVLARVTGGTASSIDGTVQCTIPGASFFLINPAGVIFGPDAALDVKGSFTVTTANYLRFADGAKFNATVPSDSVLTTAAPAAFGFLKSNPKPVTMNNSHLSVLEGQSLSLVGGNIQLSGAALSAPDGAINLTSVASKGEVSATPNLNSFATGGDIVWTEGATVDVSGQQGGQVVIRGGTLTLDNNSAITAVTEGALNGEGINIGVKGGLTLEAGSVISATTAGAGRSGDLVVNAGTISLSANGTLEANTTGAGNAGAVAVTANSLSIDGTGSSAFTGIASQSSSGASGNGGDVTVAARGSIQLEPGGEIAANTFGMGNAGAATVTAGSLSINGQGSTVLTGIASQSVRGASGNGGDVTVTVKGSIQLEAGGEISGSTYGVGNAGAATVTAGSLSVNGQGSSFLTAILSQSGGTGPSGNAGNVTVKVNDQLLVENAGEINSDTFGSGASGKVNVSAGSLTMTGDRSGYGTYISSDSEQGATGAAGGVNVNVQGQIAISGNASISSDTFGVGNAGVVTVRGGSLSINGADDSTTAFSGISSQSEDSGVGGHGGDVTVAVQGSIDLEPGADISASTFGLGNGGAVNVTAGSLTINGQGGLFFTGISGRSNGTGASGNAGTVTISVKDQFLVENEGGIDSATYGSGTAGKVNVTAGSLSILGDNSGFATGISSESNAGATGAAGDVNINVPGHMAISGNAYVSATTYGTANAGQVSVTAGTLSINGANNPSGFTGIDSDTQGTGVGGHGGDVTITVAGSVQLEAGGSISASTFGLGNAGAVNVTAGVLSIDGQGGSSLTGISSVSQGTGASGNAGTITVKVKDQLLVENEGLIASDTYGSGTAGEVNVTAGSLIMKGGGNTFDTAISSESFGLGSGGAVNITAGSLSITGASTSGAGFTGISSDSNDTGAGGNGGDITVAVGGSIRLEAGGGISAGTFGDGIAGAVSVTAGSLLINGANTSGFTGISSQSNPGASGNGGDVAVAVKGSIQLEAGGEISAGTLGLGKGGTVSVTAGSLLINGASTSGFTGIDSESGGAGTSGDAGTVSIKANGQILVENAGEITSSTYGSGNAGQVIVTAGSLTLRGDNSGFDTYISSESGSDSDAGATGAAGGVKVNVQGKLVIFGDASISSDTFGLGNAGAVNVTAGSLFINGSTTSQFSGIDSASDGTGASGHGGDVTVAVEGSIQLESGGSISASTFGLGNAGAVNVAAGSLSINGQGSSSLTGISSESNGAGASGEAGTVAVEVKNQLLVENEGLISSGTYGSGKAGQIIVTAGSLTIRGDNGGYYTAVSSDTYGSGNAGAVTVQANTISVQGEFARISSESLNSGTGGDVTVTGSDLIQINGGASVSAEASTSTPSDSGAVTLRGGTIQLNGGFINSEADGGNAGKVEVNASGLLSLYQSQILAGSHQQNGGVIGISAPYVALNQSSINANAYHTGGTIAIATPNFIESIGSAVTATSQTGHAGTVEISSPQLTLSGNLAALNLPILSAEAYLPAQCGQSLGGNVSSFIVLGRDGLPLDPGGWAASFPEEQDDHLRKHSDSRGK
jgi:filamentous hemagglutinin family protein